MEETIPTNLIRTALSEAKKNKKKRIFLFSFINKKGEWYYDYSFHRESFGELHEPTKIIKVK